MGLYLSRLFKKNKTDARNSLELYYDLDIMPIANWFKCLSGEYKYLYNVDYSKAGKLENTNELKEKFIELVYSLDRLDMSDLITLADIERLKGKALTTGKEIYRVRAEMMESSLASQKKNEKKEDLSLNKICTFIENTLKINPIDIFSMSVNRFYEYYYLAIEKNKQNGKSNKA